MESCIRVCGEVEVADILIHRLWLVAVQRVRNAATKPNLPRKLIAV